MWLSEKLLYTLARLLSRSEVCHSSEMKESLANADNYDRFRASRADLILRHAQRFGVEIRDRVVLDFGCGDGAITPAYLDAGAQEVVGLDIDAAAVARAQRRHGSDRVRFLVSGPGPCPLGPDSVDVAISYDVFEHVGDVPAALNELHRVVRPGGKVLIGTWGWYHPFAPHLFRAMPVPWAHVFFSERTLLRACRRVYDSPWYVPTMHDLDEAGKKRADRFLEEEIPRSYVNKLLVRDFERIFAAGPFRAELFPMPFGSRYARWTRVFLRTPYVREFFTGYLWVVLHKEGAGRPRPAQAPALAAR
jgi:SAM-dependent methyltransferase